MPSREYSFGCLKHLILSLHQKLCVPTIKIHAQSHSPSYQFKYSQTYCKLQKRRYSHIHLFNPPHVTIVAGSKYCYCCYVTFMKTNFLYFVHSYNPSNQNNKRWVVASQQSLNRLAYSLNKCSRRSFRIFNFLKVLLNPAFLIKVNDQSEKQNQQKISVKRFTAKNWPTRSWGLTRQG